MREDILDDGIHMPKANTIENAREILRLKGAYQELHTKVTNGRKAQYWMLGLTTVGTIVQSAQFDFDLLIVGVNLFFVVLFVTAVIVAIKKPFIGFMIGLIVLVVMQILMFVGDPMSSMIGVLWRVIIAYFMIVGLGASKEYFEVLKGLKAHGIESEGTDLV